MKKIAFTGPESTGKTTLAASLAEQYATIWVPEYAREYLASRTRDYTESDLLNILNGQLARMQFAESSQRDILFYDTEILVLKIWSEYKFGKCLVPIEKAWESQTIDLYFLCGIDVKWQPDPLREHPDNRAEIYQLYLTTLEKSGRYFIELEGSHEQRMEQVMSYL